MGTYHYWENQNVRGSLHAGDRLHLSTLKSRHYLPSFRGVSAILELPACVYPPAHNQTLGGGVVLSRGHARKYTPDAQNTRPWNVPWPSSARSFLPPDGMCVFVKYPLVHALDTPRFHLLYPAIRRPITLRAFQQAGSPPFGGTLCVLIFCTHRGNEVR